MNSKTDFIRFLFLCLVAHVVGQNSNFNLNLRLTNGQLSLVNSGIVSAVVSSPGSASRVSIPYEVSSIELSWDVSQPGVNYDLSLSSTPSSVLSTSFSNGLTGTIPTTPSIFTASFTCLAEGTATLSLSYQLNNVTTNEEIAIYLVKECTASQSSSCTACGTCVDLGTCDCIESSTGNICALKPLQSTASDSRNNVNFFSFNMGSYGVTETLEQTQSRYQSVAQKLIENDYSVVTLQGVWSDDGRQVLVEKIQENFPFISFKMFGTSTSGLFLASKYPIEKQAFEQFSENSVQDSKLSKGVHSAILRIGEGSYLHVFNTHLADYGTSEIQSSQLTQIRNFMDFSVNSAISQSFSISQTSIVLAGDFGIDKSKTITGSLSYDQLVESLNSPINALEGTLENTPTFNGKKNCTTQLQSIVTCTIGSSVTIETVSNYVFIFNEILDRKPREPKTESSSIENFQENSVYGSSLSDYKGLFLDLSFKKNIVVAVTVPVVLGTVLLVIVGLILFQVYYRKKPIPAPHWVYIYVRQARALFIKNWVLTLRNKKALIIQLLVPFVLVALLFLLQIALIQNEQRNDLYSILRNAERKPVEKIPRCVIGDENDFCYTIAYSYNNDTLINQLIAIIATDNGIPDNEIKSFLTPDEADIFLKDNNNSTQGVYHIFPVYDISSVGSNNLYDLQSISYQVQFNNTVSYRSGSEDPFTSILLPMQSSLERAILNYKQLYTTGNPISSLASGNAFDLTVNTLEFPHPELITIDVIGSSGPSFFLGCLMFNFVIQMGQLVTEKELKLREAMAVVGLRDSIYWFTWFFTNLAWNTLSGMLLIIAGLIFQFKFFLLNDFGLYFFLFFLFGLSMVSFAIFLSLFVSKARTATSVGFAIFLVGVIVQGAGSFVFSEGTSTGVQTILKFLPFTLLAKGMTDLGSFTDNDSDNGLRWSDRNDYGYFPIGDVYNWFLIDTAIYIGLALLYDFFFGGTQGESRVRRWIFRPKDDVPTSDIELTDRKLDDDVAVEEELVKSGKFPESSALVLQNLKKIYRNYKFGIIHDKKTDFTAVNGLNLHIEDGQLFCLLGHNGAGKSTTISMLTGLSQTTSGDAKVFGQSIRDDMDQIRKEMGVCSQFDILWNELTSAEHIRLFGSLKGLSSSECEQQVIERLKDVELTHVAMVPSVNYSGGMKRRLSVAIALTGGPKIVYLDEPTTGMDPVSRRQVWSLLEKEKKKRMVLLTTHSMEEADMLADNIAIMKKGQLICLGSALHLKSKFGSGYRMTLVTESESKETQTVENYVKENLPQAVLARAAPGVVHYEVPNEAADALPLFLKDIENNGSKYGIIDVQVGMTSLEDVFLKVAGLEAELPEEEPDLENDDKSETKKEEGNGNGHDNKIPEFNYGSQFKALIAKTLVLQQRQYKTNACQVLFPLVLMIVLFLIQGLVNTTIKNESGEFTPGVDHPNLVPPSLLVTADFNPSGDCPTPDLLKKIDYSTAVSDKNSGRLLYASASGQPVGSYGPPVSNAAIWSTVTDPLDRPSGFLGNVTRDISRMVGFKGERLLQQGGRVVICTTRPFFFPLSFNGRDSKESVEEALYSAWAREVYLGGYVFDNVDISGGKFAFSVMYNNTFTSGRDVPALTNLVTDSVFRTLSGPSAGASPSMVFLGTRDYPSPQIKNSFDLVSIIGIAFYIFILQLMFPVILGNLVYEKENKLREIMKMMGLKIEIYWLVTYVINLLLYLIAMLLMIAIAAAFGFRFFTANDFGTYFLLIFFWGNCMVAMSFFFGAFFTNSRTAVVFGYIVLFVTGLLSSQLIGDYFENENTPSGTKFGISIIPQFALFRGLKVLQSFVYFDGPGLKMSDLSGDGSELGEVYGFLIVEWFIFLIFAAYCDQVVPDGIGIKKHPLFFLKKSWWSRKKEEVQLQRRQPEFEETPDVQEEREKVWKDTNHDQYIIRSLDLRKIYKTGKKEKLAVKNLTMGLEYSECFGLLGPNGSGKSTTCNMLCGYFMPTEGTAMVNGLDLRTDSDLIHLLMGVCPQDNIIWEELTGMEHLLFYGRLKNLSGKPLIDEVEYRLKQVDLYRVKNKKAGQYSGGMKRRLSVAMALVGRPQVVLLDEPSTGLDPKARTNLWEVIRTAKKRSSLLLTTHSMEEAEALCERVGIFVNGEMKSLGTPARLKANFGENFKLTITVDPKDEAKAHELIMELAPHAILFNAPVQGTRSYQMSREKTKLSDVFQSVKDWDSKITITDWGISNVTLEEVFLEIALAEDETNTVKIHTE